MLIYKVFNLYKIDIMAVQRSVSITEEQNEWLIRNNISISKLVQKAIDNYINSDAINDLEQQDKIVYRMIQELKARGYLVEIRKLKAKK